MPPNPPVTDRLTRGTKPAWLTTDKRAPPDDGGDGAQVTIRLPKRESLPLILPRELPGATA